MSYAGKYKILTYLSLVLGAISGILALVPFIYIWLIIKEFIEVMPNFTDATNMIHNGWKSNARRYEKLSRLIGGYE